MISFAVVVHAILAFTVLSVLALPPPESNPQPKPLPITGDNPTSITNGTNTLTTGVWPSTLRLEKQGSQLRYGAGVVHVTAIFEKKGQECRTPQQQAEFSRTIKDWLMQWPNQPPAVTHENPYPYPPRHNGNLLEMSWFQRSSVYRYNGARYWLTAGSVVEWLGEVYNAHACVTSRVTVWITLDDPGHGKIERPLGSFYMAVKNDPFPS